MKLQINDGTVEFLANDLKARAPEGASDRDLALLVLDLFEETGHFTWTRKDIAAVLAKAAGGVEPEWELLSRVIADQGEPARDVGRGFYRHRSRLGLRDDGRLAPPAPVGEVVTSSSVKVEGVAWIPVPPSVNPDLEGFYSDDVGLRRLAISESRCFGVSYADSSPACLECPLARFCAPTSFSQLADMATALDQETEKALRDAETRKNAPPGPEERRPSEPLIPDPEPTSTVNEGDLPKGHTKLDLPFEGVCAACDATIPVDQTAIHVEGKGMYHIACAKQLTK